MNDFHKFRTLIEEYGCEIHIEFGLYGLSMRAGEFVFEGGSYCDSEAIELGYLYLLKKLIRKQIVEEIKRG